MSDRIEVYAEGDFPRAAAETIAPLLPAEGNVVITGGGTAKSVYSELARTRPDWSGMEVFFSDERCVPPDDPESNYGMAQRTLLNAVAPGTVHRMEGEIDPADAAAIYEQAVGERAFDLALLGLGDDAHVAGLFPGSPGLLDTAACVVVDRPDGLRGLSLTPPVLLSAATVVFVVTGSSKAEAVGRAIDGDEDVMSCPAAMFREHGSVVWLLDEGAGSRL